MRTVLQITAPERYKNLWRTVAIATVYGNGETLSGVSVQFALGTADYGPPVQTSHEGIAVKQMLVPSDTSTISARTKSGPPAELTVSAGEAEPLKPPAAPAAASGSSTAPAEPSEPQEARREEPPKKGNPPPLHVTLEVSEPNKISDDQWGVTVTVLVKKGQYPAPGVLLRLEPPASEHEKGEWDETDAAGTVIKKYELPAGTHTITARLKETGAHRTKVVPIKEENPKKFAELRWSTRGTGSKQYVDFQAVTADELLVPGVLIGITNPATSDWREEQKTDQHGNASFCIALAQNVVTLCATASGKNYTIRLYNP